MKITLFLVGVLAASNLWASLSQAAPAPGRKLPGPSAVEAARLKKSPPPGYLSHYLPDDRYKIAGGVWKYVSTDLDTYYHIPSSPNMLRQPASRVIGFATARDAEEAGYVADPTDGTVGAVSPSPSPTETSRKGTKEEIAYLEATIRIQERSLDRDFSYLDKILDIVEQADKQSGDKAIFLLNARPLIATFLASQQDNLKALNRLKPPQRFKKYHAIIRESMQNGVQVGTTLNQAIMTGNMPQIDRGFKLFSKGEYLKRLEAEMKRLR